jgi:hypothetical protein
MPTAKPDLLLHVGTPKTGTTSLQFALHQSHAALLRQGILYPDVDLHPAPPKHQWIAGRLLADEIDVFARNIDAVARQADKSGAQTVVLSTEGIFNHWSDFSPVARLALGELNRNFSVKVWCVFREPLSFAMSFYCQLLKNRPSSLSPCYGTALTPEDIVDHPWFAQRLDYRGFIEDIGDLFPALAATRYESSDTVAQARSLLGVGEDVLPGALLKNQSPSALGADLMRCLNRLRPEAEERDVLANMIAEIDRRLRPVSEPLRASEAVAEKVRRLSEVSVRYLTERFDISWTRQGGA